MARRWSSKDSVDNDVRVICQILQDTGAIPEQLVYSYKIMMDSVSPTKPGLVMHFYDALTTECPKALEYFK